MANNNRDETTLIPTYIEGDFDTSLSKFLDLLKQDETFKDFNYHGSNIAMITELMSYLADFSNFYANLVAKNVYLDTADVYETVHRLVTQKGYIPLGYLSSEATVSVRIDNALINNHLTPATTGASADNGQIIIEPWTHSVNTGAQTNDNEQIEYTLTEQQVIDVETLGYAEFTIPMRQGTVDTVSFTGQDLVDNLLILPFRDYDVGNYPYDVPAIQVIVNDQEWIRVHDFYDHISGLIPDERDVFTFYYDKYQRYVISFASSFEVPNPSDVITIKLLRSLGIDGIIASETLQDSNQGVNDFDITWSHRTGDNVITPNTDITTFTNLEASVGGADPEPIRDLKANADANTHTQYRNVTQKDYKFHMEMRSDVRKATAWGENEVDPGNTIEYNKVYVSVIPRDGNQSKWIQGVYNTTNIVWGDSDVPNLSASIEIPTDFLTAFETDLLQYLEPRKMISVYEFPVIPQPIYFRFDIGIRVSRAYKYTDVLNDVKNKLVYYFDSINREFFEEINFMDIHNFIYDMSIYDGDDYFLFIKGLDNLVIRDISTYTVVPAPSGIVPIECTSGRLSGYGKPLSADFSVPLSATSLSAALSGYQGIEQYQPLSVIDFSHCSLDNYLSGGMYNNYVYDTKLMMGTLTYEVLEWTGHYDVFEPNDVSNYPQYTQAAKAGYYENRLRPIQLGYNQYPMLSLDMCRFYNESV